MSSLLHLIIERVPHNTIPFSILEQSLTHYYPSLHYMEETGGEPAIMWTTESHLTIVDSADQSPIGRRSLCYDKKAWEKRKVAKPRSDACTECAQHGINLLTEAEYMALQSIHPCDTKTSSWILTPDDIRAKGGALFGDRRFDRTFIYHNGAESYYAGRGFRAKLEIPLLP